MTDDEVEITVDVAIPIAAALLAVADRYDDHSHIIDVAKAAHEVAEWLASPTERETLVAWLVKEGVVVRADDGFGPLWLCTPGHGVTNHIPDDADVAVPLYLIPDDDDGPDE